jgi:hypothetical protein
MGRKELRGNLGPSLDELALTIGDHGAWILGADGLQLE